MSRMITMTDQEMIEYLTDKGYTVLDDSPTPLRCCLGFHAWGKWSRVITNVYLGQIMGAFQKRVCLKCGEYMERNV